MTANISSYVTREAALDNDDIKAYVCMGLGFDPKITTMTHDPEKTYHSFLFVEKKSDFRVSLEKSRERRRGEKPPHMDTVIFQLGEWAASGRDGNLMAFRAAEIIAYQQEVIADLEAKLGEN